MRRFRWSLLAALGIVFAWLAVAAFAGPFSGRLNEVAKNENTAFLPANAEATRAQELSNDFTDRPTIPAVVLYERTTGLTPADRQRIAADSASFTTVEGVVTPLPPPIPSPDGQAIEQVVLVDSAVASDKIDVIVRDLRRLAPSEDGLTVFVTGPGGLLGDLVEVFKSIDVTLLFVTASVVLVILLIVYRSPVLWLVPMICAGLAYISAAATVYGLAKNGTIDLNGQAQGILTVLVFGAGTDYALLLVARYREELRRHERTTAAMRAALRGAAPAIVASGGTVIASLLCLLLSSLNSNRALGPVAAVGIACTLLVQLTLLPALLLLGGRWAFWPRVPHHGTEQPHGRLWYGVARAVQRRHRIIWIAVTLVLVGLSLGLTQLDANGLSQTNSFTTKPDSVIGQQALQRHYPAGSGSPAMIIALAPSAPAVLAAVQRTAGVANAMVLGQAGAPKVVDGRVLINATLTDPPDSTAAEQTVERLRSAVHAVPDADAVVGGFTAVNLDTNAAAIRDRNVIIPVVLLVIAVILALLLRAIVAPLVLIGTVVISFAATLGLCALLFKYVFHFAGADASFPLFAFVFLVALGVDYNIFLMTRVREETLHHGARPGVLRGLIVTGGVITSAGFVLAATFSTLAVLPLVALVEVGVAVAIGVLLDTIVVRSLLVPSTSYDIGRPVWWPGRLWRTSDRHGQENAFGE